ncbi:MAG: hypothetical protein BWX70_02793 [Verrucomicrobia bacterium ADurb.Bin070]|nr:MAG: hypothetical protein BWX70_02793 [Verrucomicrobia bacterium ADurb.Bin070]
MRAGGQRVVLVHSALTERHVLDHRAVDHQAHIVVESETPRPSQIARRTVPQDAGINPRVVTPAPESACVRTIGGLGTIAGARGKLAADCLADFRRIPILHDDTLQEAGAAHIGNIDCQQRTVARIDDLAVVGRIRRGAAQRIVSDAVGLAGRADAAGTVAEAHLNGMGSGGQRDIRNHRRRVAGGDHPCAVDDQRDIVVKAGAERPGFIRRCAVPDEAGIDPSVVVAGPDAARIAGVAGLRADRRARRQLNAAAGIGRGGVPALTDHALPEPRRQRHRIRGGPEHDRRTDLKGAFAGLGQCRRRDTSVHDASARDRHIAVGERVTAQIEHPAVDRDLRIRRECARLTKPQDTFSHIRRAEVRVGRPQRERSGTEFGKAARRRSAQHRRTERRGRRGTATHQRDCRRTAIVRTGRRDFDGGQRTTGEIHPRERGRAFAAAARDPNERRSDISRARRGNGN